MLFQKSSPSFSTHLVGIQALRGVAAWLVVMHHSIGTAVTHGFGLPFLTGMEIGNIGVDIFFVISGVIMELTSTGQVPALSPGQFLWRRAVRILPLYWFLTLLAFGLMLVVGSELHLRLGVVDFVMSMLLLPSQADSGKAVYVIPMAWSLSYEVYFYALFAVLLNVRARTRHLALAVLFTVSTVIGLVSPPESAISKILVHSMLFEFLAGCWIAHAWRRGHRLGTGAALSLVVLAIAAMWIWRYVTPSNDLRVVYWGGPAMALVAACVLIERPLPWGGTAVLARLGDVSYSLYLSHFFVLALYVRLYHWVAARLSVPDALAMAGLLGSCLLVAVACYGLIERPARRFFSRGLQRQTTDATLPVPAS